MIGFSCTNCGHSFGVQDDYLGKRIKCTKCNFVGVVIDDSGRIKITCQNCGNENNVPDTLTGQEIKCPKCDDIVIAAAEEKEPAIELNDKPKEQPEKSKDSEVSERSLIIIISAIAVVIVAVLIIMAAVIANKK